MAYTQMTFPFITAQWTTCGEPLTSRQGSTDGQNRPQICISHDPSSPGRLGPPWHALARTVLRGHLSAILLAFGPILT